MKENLGKKFVGITNSPLISKTAHGNPKDWWQLTFDKEDKARAWEENMRKRDGFVGSAETAGWKYGFTYTITEESIEQS